jgi:hypothetical protein
LLFGHIAVMPLIHHKRITPHISANTGITRVTK